MNSLPKAVCRIFLLPLILLLLLLPGTIGFGGVINLTGHFEDFLQSDPFWSADLCRYDGTDPTCNDDEACNSLKPKPVPLPEVAGTYTERDRSPSNGCGWPENSAQPLNVEELVRPEFWIPSGFNIARGAYHYGCDEQGIDQLSVGFDTSNCTYLRDAIICHRCAGDPNPTTSSVAWDVDGNGNPIVPISYTDVNRNCAIVDSIPVRFSDFTDRGPERYEIAVFFDDGDPGPGGKDEIADLEIRVIDGGNGSFGALSGPRGAGTIQLEVLPGDFPTGNIQVIYYGWQPGSTVPDLEFKVRNLRAYFQSKGKSKDYTCNYHKLSLFAGAIKDYAEEMTLNLPKHDFTQECNMSLECHKEGMVRLANGSWPADIPANWIQGTLQIPDYALCDAFPKPNVKIRYRVKNTSNCAADITVSDTPAQACGYAKSCTAYQPGQSPVPNAQFPYDEFFNVQPGQEVYIVCDVSLDKTWCGHDPCSDLMSASALPAGCCLTGSADCFDTLVLQFPQAGSFTCEKKVRKQGVGDYVKDLVLTTECFPLTLEYRLRVTNTSDPGGPNLNIKIVDDGDFPACATVSCKDGANPVTLPYTFPNVPPGESRDVICTVTFQNTQACKEFLCSQTFENEMRAEAESCCTNGGLCTSKATVKGPPWRPSNFECEKQIRKQGSQDWLNELRLGPTDCLPITVEYRLKVCNTGQTYLDLTVNETDFPACAQKSCKEGANTVSLPKTWTNVPPGECREIICTVTFPNTQACKEFLCDKTFENTMTSSAGLSPREAGCCAQQPPPPKECKAKLYGPLWRNSDFTCEKKIRKQGSQDWLDELRLAKDDCLPITVEYRLKVCNTGQTYLDLTVNETDFPACATKTCKEGASAISLPKTWKDVPPGECREVICTVAFPNTQACRDFICEQEYYENKMTSSATLSDRELGCCAKPPPPPKECKAKLYGPPWSPPSFSCEKKVRKQGTAAWLDELKLTKDDPFPITVEYRLRVCNTSDPVTGPNLDLTIVDDGNFPACAEVVCVPPLPKTFSNVPPGECRDVICTVVFPKACEKDLCGAWFENEMNATGKVTNPGCCSEDPPPCSDKAKLSFQPKAACHATATPTLLTFLPQTVEYTFRATNLATYPADIEISVDWESPAPMVSCDQALPFVCTNVPPGGSCEVKCQGTFPANFPLSAHTATMTAKIKDQDFCFDICPVTVLLTPKCIPLRQATPGRSIDDGVHHHVHYLGYGGAGGDPISSAPYVFKIDPGDKWRNFIAAYFYDAKRRDGGIVPHPVPHILKDVRLRKISGAPGQCAHRFPPKDIKQVGTEGIRLWWPLMYEPPWTTFTLTLTWWTDEELKFPTNTEDDYAHLHRDEWCWRVVVGYKDYNKNDPEGIVKIGDFKYLLELFHEIPAKTCEVPLIADENLYKTLQSKLDELQAAFNAKDMLAASIKLQEFEMMVADACMEECPPQPFPINDARGEPGAGWIMESECMPACCKILADADYILREYIWK